MKSTVIPFIPKQVKINLLYANGKLYSDKMIEKIESLTLTNGRHRYYKLNGQTIRFKYAIIKHDDACYAIYQGSIAYGSFGRIKLAQHLKSGEWFALKVQPSREVITNRRDEVIELKHLSKVSSKQYQWLFSSPICYERYSKKHGEIQNYLLMPYIEGFILEYFKSPKIKCKKIIFLNLAVAFLKEVARVNRLGIIHCDIKPENVIYNPVTDRCSLIDFGLSIKKNCLGKGTTKFFHGTPEYAAPELFDNYNRKQIYSNQTESYAAGMTLKEIFSLGSKSLENGFFAATMKSQPTQMNLSFALKVNLFLEKMIKHNPLKRPSIGDAILFFEELRKLMPKKERTIDVLLFDIATVKRKLAQDKSSPITALWKNIKNDFDVVWIVDDKHKTSIEELMAITHALRSVDILVAPIVYEEPIKKILNDNNKKEDRAGECLFKMYTFANYYEHHSKKIEFGIF